MAQRIFTKDWVVAEEVRGAPCTLGQRCSLNGACSVLGGWWVVGGRSQLRERRMPVVSLRMTFIILGITL